MLACVTATACASPQAVEPGADAEVDAAASADAFEPADAVTYGGATTFQLASTPAVLDAIAKGGWTYVVIQGQSLEPVQSQEGFLFGAKKLWEPAKAVGAVPAFFTTWPRKAGNGIYSDWTTGGSPADMAKKLQDAYQAAADASGGLRVRVGDAWMHALQEHPGIPLHEADGSHALPVGTYLAACVFAATLAKVDPASVKWRPAEVGEAEAQVMRQVCMATLACKTPNPAGCLGKWAAGSCTKGAKGETRKCVPNTPTDGCIPSACQCDLASGNWACDAACDGGVCRPLCEVLKPTVNCCRPNCCRRSTTRQNCCCSRSRRPPCRASSCWTRTSCQTRCRCRS